MRQTNLSDWADLPDWARLPGPDDFDSHKRTGQKNQGAAQHKANCLPAFLPD